MLASGRLHRSCVEMIGEFVVPDAFRRITPCRCIFNCHGVALLSALWQFQRLRNVYEKHGVEQLASMVKTISCEPVLRSFV